MHPAHLTMMSHMFTMKKRQIAVLLGEDSAPCTNNQKTSLVQTWNNFVSSNLRLPRLFGEPLSVTVVNDEILNCDFLENSSTRKKDLTYISQKARLLHLKQNTPDYMKLMLELTPKMNQDWLIVDESELINIRNDLNFLKNLIDTHEENNTMKSVPCFKETEKIMEDTMICSSDSLDVDPRNQEADIHKDMDVESFLVVSHSDVPAAPVGLTIENSMSRISNICRNAWNSLTCSLYCKPARMSVKYPLCLTKSHHYRKVNVIAVGRGRGRAKCQLRRSGVSQTLCRKEFIKSNDSENNLVDVTANDCIELDDKPDSLEFNMDTTDSTRIAERIHSPVRSHFSKGTPAKEKAKTHRKKIKTKDVTKMRYIPSSYRMSDYCEDSNDKMLNAQENSSQLRTLSENSDDDWIVFEDEDEDEDEDDGDGDGDGDGDSSMRINDTTYINFIETHDDELPSSRRLLSDSSNDSDNFNTFDSSDALNSSFKSEENDDVDGCDEISFHDGSSQLEDDLVIFTDENSEELTTQTKKVCFDPTPVVHVMVTWNYAYRAARRGPWEQYARDNERFRGRINSIAIVLDPVLRNKHRSQVWQKRFSFLE